MIVDKISYFFRTTNSPPSLKAFSIPHLILILITALGCFLIVKFRNKISPKYFKLTVAITLLIQFSLMYSWYFFGNYKTLEFGLPLYTCRISIILITASFLFNKNYLTSLALYWGFYGSLMSMCSPDVDSFSFPHFTYFSYFVGHIVLLWACVYLIYVERFPLPKKDLINNIKLSFLLNIPLYIFDTTFNVNYNYLVRAPIFTETLAKLNPLVYFLFMQVFFALIFVVSYYIINALKKSVAN